MAPAAIGAPRDPCSKKLLFTRTSMWPQAKACRPPVSCANFDHTASLCSSRTARIGFVQVGTPLRQGTPVEVRCHPGCPWMDRFVVEGEGEVDGRPAYLVSRLGLSILVPAEDVRPAH
jgi:hypothetical protein